MRTPGREGRALYALRFRLRWAKSNWLLVAGFALALAVRLYLVPVVVTGDYMAFLVPWFKKMARVGTLRSFGMEISNYSPPYMYLLALASLFKPHPLSDGVKAISISFDLLASLGVYKVVRLFHPKNSVPALAACCFLLAPTPLLNGSMWAQCDVIHTSFLILALYAALSDRPLVSALCFSVAASIKMQALFFLPALGFVFVQKRWSPAYALLIPVAYVVFAIPPILLGRSAANVFTIYLRQVDEYTDLAMGGASIYQWIPTSTKPTAQLHAGLAFAAAACAVSGYVLLTLARRRHETADLLHVVLFLSALPPFFLPRMHERYAFASDTVACIVPFVTPALAVPALLLMGASFVSYGSFMNAEWMPKPYAALIDLVALVMIARRLAADLGITEALAAVPSTLGSTRVTFAPPPELVDESDASAGRRSGELEIGESAEQELQP
jgi:Gpi18-like mannosyltransferase